MMLSCSAYRLCLMDAKGILPCLWPTADTGSASLFLNVFTTERGRKDEERDIRQPQNLQRIAGLRSFFTGVSDAPLLFIFVRYQQRGARLGPLHTSSPNSTYWFITNYLSRGPESVPCIIAGVTLDNGWMKLSSLYTKWQWHLQKIL